MRLPRIRVIPAALAFLVMAPAFAGSRYAGTFTGKECSIHGHACDVRLTIDETGAKIVGDLEEGVSIRIAIDLADSASGQPIEIVYPFTGIDGGTELDKADGTLLASSKSAGAEGIPPIRLECLAVGAAKNGSTGWSCEMNQLKFKVAPQIPS